jgi:hypothetical protein
MRRSPRACNSVVFADRGIPASSVCAARDLEAAHGRAAPNPCATRASAPQPLPPIRCPPSTRWRKGRGINTKVQPLHIPAHASVPRRRCGLRAPSVTLGLERRHDRTEAHGRWDVASSGHELTTHFLIVHGGGCTALLRHRQGDLQWHGRADDWVRGEPAVRPRVKEPRVRRTRIRSASQQHSTLVRFEARHQRAPN